MASFSKAYDVTILKMEDQRRDGSNDLASGAIIYEEIMVPSQGHSFGTLSEGHYVLISIHRTHRKNQWLLNLTLGESPSSWWLLNEGEKIQSVNDYNHYLILGPQNTELDIPLIQKDLNLSHFAKIYRVESPLRAHSTLLSYEGNTGVFFCVDSMDGEVEEQLLPLPHESTDIHLRELQEYLEGLYMKEKHLFSQGMPKLIKQILDAHDQEEVGLLAAEEMKNASLFESKKISKICTLLQTLQYKSHTPEEVLSKLKTMY